MYKLTLGSINELKYSNTPQHGLFSGTIETDRVVLVDGDGKYLQVDGNFGTDLKNGLVRTYSASRDAAEIAYKIATTNATDTAAVFVYDGMVVLQSAYSSVDGFIEQLADEGVITIQNYESPKYELASATVKTAGTGYTTASVDVTVAGETGDTAGVVTCTITEGAISAVEIKSAGSYEKLVASQDVDVAGGTGVITVTMQLIEAEESDGAKSAERSAPVEEKQVEEPVVSKKGAVEEPEVEEKTEEPEAKPEPEEVVIADDGNEEGDDVAEEEVPAEPVVDEVSEPEAQEEPEAPEAPVAEEEPAVEPEAEPKAEPEAE